MEKVRKLAMVLSTPHGCIGAHCGAAFSHKY
jgi:hypothetical protein